MNITHLIFKQYQRHPYKKAVIFPHKKRDSQTTLYSHYTYEQLHDQSNTLAYSLQQMGIVKDTKILLFIKPSLHFSLVTFTLFKIGAIPIFIDPGMGLKNLIRSIKEVSPHALIGVPKVHFLRLLFPKAFSSISLFISTGGFPIPFTISLNTLLKNNSRLTNDFPIANSKESDPAFSANIESSTASEVEFDPVPAITGIFPPHSLTAISIIFLCSSWDKVGDSPVVPPGTTPFVPFFK